MLDQNMAEVGIQLVKKVKKVLKVDEISFAEIIKKT